MDDFEQLCLACRKGDYESVEKFITFGVDTNQKDEWDYSPLVLASICGHEDIVKLLLENGSMVDRDSFDGARAIYGALTDSIRNILISYDISKAVDLTQPFASHLSSLLLKPKFTTADILLKCGSSEWKVHKFILRSFSSFFDFLSDREITTFELTEFKESSWKFLIEYIYFSPNLHQELIIMSDLRLLSEKVDRLDVIEAVEEIRAHSSIADQAKIKNKIQKQKYSRARQYLRKLLLEPLITKKSVLSPIEIESLVSLTSADVILSVPSSEHQTYYYPVHRAILCRSPFFQTLFDSSFLDTSIYNDIITDEDVVNMSLIKLEEIPIIGIPWDFITPELTTILLSFLYMDIPTIRSQMLLPSIQLADILFLDRLKSMATVSLTALQSSFPAYVKSDINVHKILRVAWDARAVRLEHHAAWLISLNLEYFTSGEERELLKKDFIESASRIAVREEVDSIELVDDIRWYLSKRYVLDTEEGTLDPASSDIIKMYDEDYVNRLNMYEKDIETLNLMVFECGINVSNLK